MLCASIRELATLPRVITDEAVALVALMSRAAILEVEARGDAELTLEAWHTIAEGKTGALFGWCGRAGAHLAADPDALERFDACGRHLGLAFQLADDLKDVSSSNAGKDRFADIRNRNPSYILVTACQRSPAVHDALRQLWTRPTPISYEEAAHLGQLVLDTGVASDARDAITSHVARAFDSLGHYRDRDGGDEVVAWAMSLSQTYLANVA
jgi:octaprenyl-diphosphate synthase